MMLEEQEPALTSVFDENCFTVNDAGEMSLAYRPMQTIPSQVIDDVNFLQMTKLDLTETHITDLSSLKNLTSLAILILDKNELRSIKSCPVIKSLHTFWCNNNEFDDLEEIINDILERFPNLLYLSMMRNPCSPGLLDIVQPDLEDCKMYRRYVLYRMPHLKVLDSTTVEQEELADAKLRGQYSIKSKSVQKQYSNDEIQPAGKANRIAHVTSLEETLSSAHEQYENKSATKFKGKVKVPQAISLKNPPKKNSEGNRFIVNSQL